MDIDSIPLGVDFRHYITDATAKCLAMLVVIGEKWSLSATRLKDPRDFVRVEIESALRLGRPVIPILIGNTPMPNERDLPPSLEMLSYLNAIRIDPGRDFHHHVDGLIRALTELMVNQQKPAMQDTLNSTDSQQVVLPTAAFSPVLEIASGPKKGTQFKLVKDRELIGRKADCDISISDVSLSNYHGQFLKDAEGYRFEDLGSTNGSYLNGNRVSDRVLLKDGDRLHFGKFILIYHNKQ